MSADDDMPSAAQVRAAESGRATHPREPHSGGTAGRPIFTAGLAGLVAGAVSMALGEYVSVSSQRDSERAQIKQEKRDLAASRRRN